MQQPLTRSCEYRGRPYWLLWQGTTNGKSVSLLQWLNRSHKFWVPSREVTETTMRKEECPTQFA